MADDPGTLEQMAQQFALALAPLEVLLAPENFTTLLVELGLDTPPDLQADVAFVQKLSDAIDKAVTLGPELENVALAADSGSDDDLITAVNQLLEDLFQLASALDALAADFRRAATGLMDPSSLESFVEEMVERIFENALVRYLESNYPRLWQVLALTTIVQYAPFDIVTDSGLTTVLRRRFHFDRIGGFLANPLDMLQEGYGWGTEQFDGKALFSQFSDASEALQLLDDYAEASDAGTASFDLFSLTFGPTENIHPPGIQAKLFIDIPSTTDLTLSQFSDNWRLAFQFSSALAAGSIFRVLPPTRFELDADATVQGSATLGLIGQGQDPNSSFVLLGQTAGSSLQATKVAAGLVGNFQWDAETNNVSTDAGLQATFTQGKLIIDLSSADGFVTSVSSQHRFQAAFDLTIGWSTLRGFYIDGGSSSETVLPLHISVGPIALELLYLDLGVASDGLGVTASLAANVTLGPISATIDRLGVTSKFAFKRGNSGPLDFDISFKPPNGLGLSIDAGVVSGGGYISFDQSKGQYAGVLDVTLAEIVAVKVIGVLDTKLPDGSSGYSFLLIITFNLPPIQLGFGFTLSGVGGLGGVNRTMIQDALRAGLRAHTLDDILFPADPIANAPQIISDIESFFPPQQGRYLFGPMVQIGWGELNLIEFDLGIILEVPDPVRLTILGEIAVAIPDPDVALISFKIDVLGTLDFGLDKIAIDGDMYDSYVLWFQISGDMAFRLNWGANPEFLLSLGGFNPKFQPPPDVPALQRLSVSLGSGSNPRFSANSYFAVTSNTLQFGANVDAYAAAGGFSVHGYIGWDALFIFTPFSFEIDFSAGFDISYEGASLAGIQLTASLSGPQPWHLHGSASFNILFFSVSATIDLGWGDSTTPTVPSQPVMPPLLAALGDPRNWSVTLPPTNSQTVSLRTIVPDAGTIVVHPLGSLSVRETIVPLDITISRFNSVTPSDGNEFQISAVTVNGAPADTQPLQEDFAIAQFTDMSDADKLSAPSYELFDAGVTLGAIPIESGDDSARTVTYQERYIDDYNALSRFGSIYQMPANVHSVLVRSGQAAVVPSATTGLRTYIQPGMKSPISVSDMAYAVGSTSDLTARTDALGSSATHYAAVTALRAFIAANPGQQGAVQVLTAHEVAA